MSTGLTPKVLVCMTPSSILRLQALPASAFARLDLLRGHHLRVLEELGLRPIARGLSTRVDNLSKGGLPGRDAGQLGWGEKNADTGAKKKCTSGFLFFLLGGGVVLGVFLFFLQGDQLPEPVFHLKGQTRGLLR